MAKRLCNEAIISALLSEGSIKAAAEALGCKEQTIQNATRVFRLNENGLGYSNNGYSGPYETAITADGLIVTDRFVGNTISGVKLESTDNGAQVVVNSGNYEINEVSGNIVTNVGKIGFKPQTSFTSVDTMAVEVANGGAIVIGEYDYPKIVFYSNPPSGALPLHVYDNIRFYWDVELEQVNIPVDDGQGGTKNTSSLVEILQDFDRRISALE